MFGAPAWLGGVHVAVTDHETDGLEGVGDYCAAGWTVDVLLAA